jgi:hypothetical protein
MLFYPSLVEAFFRKIQISPMSVPSAKNAIDEPVFYFGIAHIHPFSLKAGLLPSFPG